MKWDKFIIYWTFVLVCYFNTIMTCIIVLIYNYYSPTFSIKLTIRAGKIEQIFEFHWDVHYYALYNFVSLLAFLKIRYVHFIKCIFLSFKVLVKYNYLLILLNTHNFTFLRIVSVQVALSCHYLLRIIIII